MEYSNNDIERKPSKNININININIIHVLVLIGELQPKTVRKSK